MSLVHKLVHIRVEQGGSERCLPTLDPMTTRERLHRLVDELSDDKAAEAFALLESQLAAASEPAPPPEAR